MLTLLIFVGLVLAWIAIGVATAWGFNRIWPDAAQELRSVRTIVAVWPVVWMFAALLLLSEALGPALDKLGRRAERKDQNGN